MHNIILIIITIILAIFTIPLPVDISTIPSPLLFIFIFFFFYNLFFLRPDIVFTVETILGQHCLLIGAHFHSPDKIQNWGILLKYEDIKEPLYLLMVWLRRWILLMFMFFFHLCVVAAHPPFSTRFCSPFLCVLYL